MNDLQRKFLDEYMIDFNGTQAAIRSGYSVHSAKTTAWSLLQRREIRDEVDRRIAEQRSHNILTVSKIEGMLRDLAEVEPLDIWDEEGNVRPLQDIPPHARKAIKSIKRVTKEHYVTGEEEVTVQVELWDKKGAIELLGKYKKMFTDKIEHSGEVGQKVSFSINGVVK